VKWDHQFAMVVVPATDHINFSELKDLVGVKEIDLARESDFKANFRNAKWEQCHPSEIYMECLCLSQVSWCLKIKLLLMAGSHSELSKCHMKILHDW